MTNPRNQVEYFSALLSAKQYDGIIGLSQGAAMTALLVSMVAFSFPHPCRGHSTC